MSGVFPEQRMSIVTLGVNDLAAATSFYKDVMGLKPFMEMEGAVTFFDMKGFALGLFPQDELEKDIKIEGGDVGPETTPRMALAYNTRSEAEVDEMFDKLAKIDGVTITKAPEKVFWGGYAGYFRDPEGHAWEIAFNPIWPFHEDGRINPEAAGG